MATNPYINKVIFGQNTLIDISDSNVVESDVAAGKKFYKADGSPAIGTSSGGAGSAIIVDTLDEGGGTIRTITTTDEYHVQASKTVTPTDQVQVITPDTGYDALASVTVNAGGGGGDVDVPIFSDVWDDSWETQLSMSCNKTYAECFALYASGNYCALYVSKNESDTEEYSDTLILMSGGGSELVYSAFSMTTPRLDIHYSSNGEFSVVSPSAFTETLNITQNGTYYPSGNAITEVDVNVPTPTPTLIAKSITANGTYNASSDSADGYSSVTVNVPSGGGGGSADDVIFIDYDGTVLHSYSASDFQALTAMPSNPSHTGLTAQGWNWSLADAKTYLTNYPNARVVIGQMFITDDRKTRIYIHLEEERKSPMLGICPNGTVDVDWGDGSTHDTLTGTSLSTVVWTSNHEYAHGGDYVITLTVTTGNMAIMGSSSTNRNCQLLHYSSTADQRNNIYIRAIKKVEVGEKTYVSSYAFYYCESLIYATIPSGVIINIGIQAFSFCRSLESLTVPDGVTSLTNSVFYGCQLAKSLSIPNSVTSINSGAFRYCYNLKYTTIPGGVTGTLGEYMFQNCYNLSRITIPTGITSIGTFAFQACDDIKSITIPNGVTSIGNSAFTSCRSLVDITIPDSVVSVGTNVVSSCYSLSSVSISKNLTSIGDNMFSSCYSLSSITVPSGVTSIGSSAFSSCHALENISLPDSLTSIGSSAFAYCYTMKNLTIPSGITGIPGTMLSSCYSLASITIPSGVTSIGANAFQVCYGVAEYHLLPTTPPTLANTNAFSSIQADCKIYVPYSADHSILEAYQTATNWSSLSQYIVEEPQS